MTTTKGDDIKSMIEQALTSGVSLALDYEKILKSAQPDSQGDAVIIVDIDDIDSAAAKVASLAQLSGLVGGQSLTAMVPNGILPAADLTVQHVGFHLFATAKRVGSISCTVGFSSNGGPLSWTIASIGAFNLSVTLDTVTVTWTEPLQPDQMFGASIYGSATIGVLPLDVTITFPDMSFVIAEPKNRLVGLGDFFSQFGLPKVDFIDKLILRDFELSASPGDGSFELGATIETDGAVPLPLLVIGGRTILAFDQMWFAFSHAPGATSGRIGGQVTVIEDMVLNASADFDISNNQWAFHGDIDVSATWLNFNTGDLPAKPAITVLDLAKMFAPNSSPPAALNDLAIEALSFDYTYAKDGGSTYALNGVFDASLPWTVGNLSAQLTVVLGRETDVHGAVVDHNVVSAEFDLEGVTFLLSYTFGNDGKKIDAKIDAPGVLSLSGSYDTDSKLATLQFDSNVQFDRLIAWIVGEVTDNRYFALPTPWDDVLAKVTLPTQGLDFKIHTDTKAISCDYTLPNAIEFLGFKLTGVSINYDPTTKPAGSSGLSVTIQTNLPPEVTIGTWDPGKQQPPKVPGTTPSLLEIKLLAAGQHIGFITAPATAEAAVTILETALNPANWTGGLFPANQMTFDKNIGWLIGSEIVILGQVDIKFIFNDPTIYGLSLLVQPAPKGAKPSAIDALEGLFAEILYRKVSDTVGVYEGILTLPARIAKIDLGAVVVTLPQFALSIYTNGDFKIDVGFPYNRDFSRSCSVAAGEYAGAGGFYYAKLDGLDPSELPQVNPAIGGFSPVTEIGIGFEIGVTKGFSSGPLSASFSVMVQGIFQGTFAKYTQYSSGLQDEYFAVDATIAIVGHLIGELDFAIITASLEVTIYVEVDLKLIAHRQAIASVEVGVSVELTVSINCGLFTIHIHCGFSTTVHAQASFGSDTAALWDSALMAPAHRRLMAMAMAPAADAPPPPIVWQPITDGAALTVYFIPQLTAGLAYPNSDGNDHWYYVGQLALSNPLANGGNAGQDPSYAKFVRGMMRWALYATQGPEAPADANTADTTPISLADVVRLRDALGDLSRSAWPQLADVKAQFGASFKTSVSGLPAGANNFGIGFFPAIPGMNFSVQGDTHPALSRAPATLSPAQLETERRGGAADVARTTFLAASVTSGLLASTTPQSIDEMMIVDFAMLAVRSGLQQIIDKNLMADTGTITIGAVLDALAAPALGAVTAISGMTTRFMLNGTRRRDDSNVIEPLYALTGQQQSLGPNELQADNLTVTLNFAQNTAAEWGVSLAGGSSLSLSSADPNSSVFKPKSGIPATPSFTPSDVQTSPMPVADTQAARFYLKTGIQENNGPGIWQLPQSLADHLAAQNGDDSFAVSYLAKPDGPPVAATASFVFTLDFRVRRIPANDGSAGYLDNTYELFAVDQGGIQSLQTLVTAIAANQTPVSGLALAYASEPAATGGGTTARTAVIEPIDFSRTFIVQSNFSTETRPTHLLEMRAAAVVDPAIGLFLTKLWTAGITNSGGYYLFNAPPSPQTGFPASLFDQAGVGTLTLIAQLTLPVGNTAVTLPAYVTGLRTPDYPVGGPGALYLSGSLQTVRAILPAGHVGVLASCIAPSAAPPPAGVYGDALNRLYNLITAETVTIDGSVLPQAGLPPVFGPIDPASGADGRWHYRHVYPLVGLPPPVSGLVLPQVPPAKFNPYQFIGRTAAFDLVWTDLFGNQWGPVGSPVSTLLGYNDPLISLSQLPYLALDYMFDKTSGQLQIAFLYGPPTYLAGDDTRRLNDIATYAQAYYQFANIASGPQMTASVATSLVLAGGVTASIRVDPAIIAGNIAKIYAALVALPVGMKPPPGPALDPIAIAMPPSGTALNNALRFALTVELTCTRTGPVAAGFAADGPIKTASITISPHSEAVGNDPHSLTAFAAAFESAFATEDMVLAVGASAGQGLAVNTNQVWVLRYGPAGIAISFPAPAGIPAYFAPCPLDNVLLADSILVPQVQADGTLGTPSTIKVTDVDLDAQMLTFLSSVDTMFSATDAIPAALLNLAAVNDLSASKKAMVETLVGYVTDLTTGASFGDGTKYTAADPIFAAADRYRQECLIRLGAFYDMNAVAVLDVSTVFNGADPKLNIFGHTVPTSVNADAPDERFTFTSGKCALSTSAIPMAFGLFAKQASAADAYVGQRSFQIDAIEHDVVPVTVEGTTYQVGSWLKFIQPRPKLDMPALAIPIPLRAFPQTPQLTRQFALELIADPQAPATRDPNVLLKRAKSWSLNGTYVHAFVAQDNVHLDVRLNIGLATGAARPMFAAVQKTLLEALVAFNQTAPQLQAIFTKDGLTAIRSPDKTTGPDATVLKNALASFAALVHDVTYSTWPSLEQQTPLRLAAMSDTGLVERESFYTITDGAGAQYLSDPWLTKVTFIGNGTDKAPVGIIPQLRIDGYNTIVDAQSDTQVTYKYHDSTGKLLDAGTASQNATRTVTIMPPYPATAEGPFAPLDIVDRQNGLLSMMVLRNEKLPPKYQYQTPWVAYPEQLAPTLDTSVPIDISGIGQAGGVQAKRSVEAHLTALFTALVRGSGFGHDQPLAGSFQSAAFFAYPLMTGSGDKFSPAVVDLPIMLRLTTPIEFDGPISGTYAKDMADLINDWLSANGMKDPAQLELWQRSQIRLDLSLFSSVSVTGRPILRLRSLFIPCAQIG